MDKVTRHLPLGQTHGIYRAMARPAHETGNHSPLNRRKTRKGEQTAPSAKNTVEKNGWLKRPTPLKATRLYKGGDPGSKLIAHCRRHTVLPWDLQMRVASPSRATVIETCD